EVRGRVIAAIRDTLTASLQALSDLAVQETGLGRVEDKLLKNRLVIERTPGTEDLEPVAWTGDHGLTLLERAPYGAIAVLTPATNPSEPIINTAISMTAGGNTCVSCPPPTARKVSSLTIDLINRAARRAGATEPLLHSVAEPSLDVAKAMLRYPGIRLNVVTG